MHNIEIPLLTRFTRPTISLYSSRALIDTGAEWLIIDMDEKSVIRKFGAKKIPISGDLFGISEIPVQYQVFLLDHFCIENMIYKKFPAIVAPINDPNVDIIIGSSMYSRGSKITIDTDRNSVIFDFTDVFFLSGKPWIRRNGEWRYLDVRDGKLVALTAN